MMNGLDRYYAFSKTSSFHSASTLSLVQYSFGFFFELEKVINEFEVYLPLNLTLPIDVSRYICTVWNINLNCFGNAFFLRWSLPFSFFKRFWTCHRKKNESCGMEFTFKTKKLMSPNFLEILKTWHLSFLLESLSIVVWGRNVKWLLNKNDYNCYWR